MDKFALIKAQNRMLEMGIVITSILEKYNVRYILMFGTLLGAVRHNGFVPWDDDFDISIFEEDYSKAIEVLRNELPNNLFLEDEKSEPLYFHAWAHVKDCNSIVERSISLQDSKYSHKGISVDLYKIKRMKLSEVTNYVINEEIEYLNRRYNKNLIETNEYINRIELLNIRKKETCKEKLSNDRDVFAFVTTYKNKYVEIDDILPITKITFGGHIFNSPNNYHNVLTTLYGNYMELPPEEKRVSHLKSISFLDI